MAQCPNDCAPEHRREVWPCGTCGEPWQRIPTKGQVPKAGPCCRTASGNRLHRIKCWVCGTPTRKLLQQAGRRPTCGPRCHATLLGGGLGRYPSRSDFERLSAAPGHALVRYAPDAAAAARAIARFYGRIPAAPARRAFTAGACVVCGGLFVAEDYTGSARYCGVGCLRRDARDKRRARVRSAYVEPVSWCLVLRDHGSACYLCGEDVDPNDFAYVTGRDGRPAFAAGIRFPTLEHVVALKNGGLHSRANGRLAHLLCNSQKGDRV